MYIYYDSVLLSEFLKKKKKKKKKKSDNPSTAEIIKPRLIFSNYTFLS